MARNSDDEELAFWQGRARGELTPEDLRQIREGLAEFFRIVSAWQAAKSNRRRDRPAPGTERAKPEKDDE